MCLRCFRPRPLSLKSITRCCDVSTRALAIAIPDCPGGGIPDGTLGRYSNTVRTPALLPQHGSMAMGFGTACSSSSWSPPTSSTTATDAKGRLAICCRSLISCSLRREAQQVCLIFQTTAATSSRDRKQLKKVTKNCTRSMMLLC